MYVILPFFIFVQQNLRLSPKIWEMRISGHKQKFKHTHTGSSRGFWERGRTVGNHKDGPHTLALTCTPTSTQRQAVPSPLAAFFSSFEKFLRDTREVMIHRKPHLPARRKSSFTQTHTHRQIHTIPACTLHKHCLAEHLKSS